MNGMPLPPWIRPLALIGLLVLAGCTTLGGPPAAEPSPPKEQPATATVETTTPTPHTSPGPARPPGVTEATLQNTTALLDAHRAALQTAGYRVTELTAETQRTYVATANSSAYRIIPGPTTSEPAVWANDTLALAKQTQDNRTVYDRHSPNWIDPVRLTGTTALREWFTSRTFVVTGTARCGARNCTTLKTTNSSQSDNPTARALVAASGVIYQFHATNPRPSRNQTRTSEYHFVLEEFGTTDVDRPPWVDTALHTTAATDAACCTHPDGHR